MKGWSMNEMHDLQHYNEPQHGAFLMIPSFIADDPDIDDSTAMLFGRILALSNKFCYCWASNEHLAKLTRVCEREIKNRLKVLEDKGYIKRETFKSGMNWERRIYPQFEFKKSSAKGIPVPDRRERGGEQAFPIEGNKRSPNINNCYIDKQQQAPAAAPLQEIKIEPYECLHPLPIDVGEKVSITKAYPEAAVKHAVEFTLDAEKKKKIKTTFIQTLKWACSEQPDIPKDKEDIANNNKEYAKTKAHLKSKYATLELLSKSLEIIHLGQMPPYVLNYDESSFKELLDYLIKKYEFY